MRDAAFALMVAALAGCGGDTAGTVCGLEIAEIVASAIIVETGPTTLVELSLASSHDEAPEGEEAPSRSLCDDDEIRVNNTRARPIERAVGHPVYSANLAGSSPQYTIRVTHEGETVAYTLGVDTDLELQAPASGAEIARGAATEIRWAPAAAGMGDVVLVDVRDEIDGLRCLAPFEAVVATGSSAEIGPGQVAVAEGVDPLVECAALIRLVRTAAVELIADASNPADFHPDSRALAFVSRERHVRSVP